MLWVFGHSVEVCDLKYSDTVELKILAVLHNEGITPDLYGRMIDDTIIIIDCADTEFKRIDQMFQPTDIGKQATFKQSTQSADYLDVAVFKGPQFTLIGKLDTKQYTNPTSSSLHLPRQSHQGLSAKLQATFSPFGSRTALLSTCCVIALSTDTFGIRPNYG